MAYRVEMATTKRAICRNTECKKQGIKIDKNELRFGSWVDYDGERQSWAWKHWGCVTPVQIAGVKDTTEGDMDMLDGYEDLPNDLQEKVKQAFEDGHVADDDWKGDLEQNRPGMRGFRSPATKKAMRQAVNEEGSGDDDGDKSPSEAASQKRGRVKNEELEDEREEPAKKKAKAPKKGKKVESEEENDGMAVDEPIPAPSKSATKKGRKPKAKDSEPKEAMKPTKTAAAKKIKASNEEEATDNDEKAPTAPKKSKAAGKKGKQANEETAEAPTTGDRLKKAPGRPRKAQAADAEVPNPAEPDDRPAKTSKKTAATKNTANTKKPIAKRGGEDVDTEAGEAPAKDAPKAKKGRKKANKSS